MRGWLIPALAAVFVALYRLRGPVQTTPPRRRRSYPCQVGPTECCQLAFNASSYRQREILMQEAYSGTAHTAALSLKSCEMDKRGIIQYATEAIRAEQAARAEATEATAGKARTSEDLRACEAEREKEARSAANLAAELSALREAWRAERRALQVGAC